MDNSNKQYLKGIIEGYHSKVVTKGKIAHEVNEHALYSAVKVTNDFIDQLG